jgi:hypothetical protein
MSVASEFGQVDNPKYRTKGERRIFEINTVFHKSDKSRRFKSNEVETAKYNIFTFLPKNLFF